ncbi:SMI1/KNR4 family protein [Bacillus sp. 1P06AnD]|uniref:SMI1/KNR4 family protein n=1 Tax=Bacillus sp. 1P06AnD TaxID=3132208 RepID=UPI0039A33C5E
MLTFTLGALFPEEYKELFLASNGVKFGDWTLFPIKTSEHCELGNIVIRNKDDRPKDLPLDMICIGENLKGDKMCYRVRKRFMQEYIFIWNEKNGIKKYPSSSLSEIIDRNIPKAKKNKPVKVGTFLVESEKLIITDPGYRVDEEQEMQIIIENVKKGTWNSSISYSDEEVVDYLLAFHGDKKPRGKWHLCDKWIGIDSAKAGIFDLETFGRDEMVPYEVENTDDLDMDEEGMKYFVACCDKVSSNAQGGVVPGGAVSMSGYGDGVYQVNVKYNISKEVVGVMIDFRNEE